MVRATGFAPVQSASQAEMLLLHHDPDEKKGTPQFAQPLLGEANELTAIAASSINAAKGNSD